MAPQTGSMMAGIVLVALGPGWGPGHTPDIPVDIRSGSCFDIRSDTLGMVGTS